MISVSDIIVTGKLLDLKTNKILLVQFELLVMYVM
jgi:hypothetical protein